MTRAWWELWLRGMQQSPEIVVPGRERAGKKYHISLLLSSSHLPVRPVGQILLEANHWGSPSNTLIEVSLLGTEKSRKGRERICVRKWTETGLPHSIHFWVLFRWRNHPLWCRGDTNFHQLPYSGGMMSFSHDFNGNFNCNIYHHHNLSYKVEWKGEKKNQSTRNVHNCYSSWLCIWLLGQRLLSRIFLPLYGSHFPYPLIDFSWTGAESQTFIPELSETIVQSLLSCYNFLLRKWFACR